MFGEDSYKYYKNNYTVIPVNGKIPVINDWSSLAHNPPSEITYESWEKKYSNLGIGLLLGSKIGIVAIDIDKDDALTFVPDSPVKKKGLKGETRFFKYNGELSRKFHKIGVEILSDGNQTVCPPSAHPNGGFYKWTGTHALYDIDQDELPILDKDFTSELEALENATENYSKASRGRNTTLVGIAGAMISRREPVDVIIKELTAYDNENHNPPYFTDKTEYHKGTGYVAALMMVTDLMKTALRKGEDPTPVEINFTFDSDDQEEDVFTQEDTFKLPTVKFPEPKYFLEPLTEHILSVSYKNRPKFALASSLSLIGTIASNKYSFKKATPNLYQMFIADSGEGKDAPLKYPYNMLAYVQCLRYHGFGTYRSDKAIIQGLEDQLERLDIIDEVSKLFKSMNNGKHMHLSSSAELLTELWSSSNGMFMGQKAGGITTGLCMKPCVSILTATTPDAFSKSFSENNIMQGFGGRFLYIVDNKKTKIKKESEVVSVEDCLNNELINFVMELSRKEPKYAQRDVSEMGIVVHKMIEGKLSEVQLQSINEPKTYEIPYDKKVQDMLDEYLNKYDDLSYKVVPSLKPVIHRCSEQIKKIAICHYVSRIHWQSKRKGSYTPAMCEEDLMFAEQYVDACLKNTELFFGDHLIQSKFQEMRVRVETLLENERGNWVSRSILTKKLHNIYSPTQLFGNKPGKIEGIIGELVKLGSISHKVEQTSRRPKELFKLG